MSTQRRLSLLTVIGALFLFTFVNADIAAAKTKPITLRYASMDSAQGWAAQHAILPYTAEVEKATGGQVKFEIYWSNTLSKPQDNWEAVKSGIADVAVCVPAFSPGLTPLSEVISLPFIGVESAEQAAAILWQLYEKFPTIKAEYKDVHVLFFGTAIPCVLMTTQKQVKTLADMKGLKIRIGGGPPTAYLKSVGASPMLASMTDTYMNLQKKVFDGVVATYLSVDNQKFHEVVRYVTNIPVYSSFAARVMNRNVWNRLPADVQEAINGVSGLERSKLFSKGQFDDQVEQVKAAKYDLTHYTPTAQEMAEWKKSADPIHKKWVADMTAAGHPEAQDILDTIKALLKAN